MAALTASGWVTGPMWPSCGKPTLSHRADSLDLLQDMIVAGLGVGLLPEDGPTHDGVRVLPLRRPDVRLRAHAVVGRGRAGWPPLALLLQQLRDQTQFA